MALNGMNRISEEIFKRIWPTFRQTARTICEIEGSSERTRGGNKSNTTTKRASLGSSVNALNRAELHRL